MQRTPKPPGLINILISRPLTYLQTCILDRWRRNLVNSEELELSLRTEFESYLNDVLARTRQEASEFQSQIEAEFEKHRTQLNDAFRTFAEQLESKPGFDEQFRAFAERLDSKPEFDDAFRGSVSEHLRLARDEGARITANAMAEAETMKQDATPAPSYDRIRDAVDDISSKDSQSAILKSLVEHAGEFAPRGAFFIIKNEHLVGWKVFGSDTEAAESAIREVHFPISSESILGEAIQSLKTVERSAGAHSADSVVLDPLHFGQPERMYALPLIARGRGVAVLYADHGGDNGDLNREAIETLVRVAGLTVELLAATQTATAENRAVGAADFEDAQHDSHEHAASQPYTPEPVHQDAEPQYGEMPQSHSFGGSPFDQPSPEPIAEASHQADSTDARFAFSEGSPFRSGVDTPFDAAPEYVPEPETSVPGVAEPFGFSESRAEPHQEESEPAFGDFGTQSFDTQPPSFEQQSHQFEPVAAPFDDSQGHGDQGQGAQSTTEDAVFESGASIEQVSPFDQPAAEYEPAVAVVSGGYNQVVEPVAESLPAASAPKARLSDRPVDLPIEVPDEERRIHNDARRFARLLVSEIKLYNEKKVTEGRESQDLYERLREAIDRSREMYDKRVQPPVAAKFDYFHYEIVNSLADGDAQRLGTNYPGSRV